MNSQYLGVEFGVYKEKDNTYFFVIYGKQKFVLVRSASKTKECAHKAAREYIRKHFRKG